MPPSDGIVRSWQLGDSGPLSQLPKKNDSQIPPGMCEGYLAVILLMWIVFR